MPTYQYACAACGHELEAVQSFTDAALTECPTCGGNLRKRFSAVGIVFKGSGFYRTDSRAGGSSQASVGASSGSESSSGSSSSGSSKPAADSSSSGSSSSGSTSGTSSSAKPAPAPAA